MANERKKVRPADGTAEQATEMAALAGTAISTSNFTLDGAGRQGRIFSLLLAGEQNAIPASDLTTLAGYKNQRSMRMAIDHEREIGLPVLASENGYFRPSPGPAGIAEMRRFLRRQDARMISNRRTTRLIRAQLKSLENAPLDGQEALSEWHKNG